MTRVERYPRQVAHAPGGEAIELAVAGGTLARMIGLLSERELPRDLGLVIPTCDSVHCIGMRFTIDVAFLRWPPDGSAEVLSVAPAVRPWRLARVRRRALGLRRREVAALELAEGRAAELGLEAGAALRVAAADGDAAG